MQGCVRLRNALKCIEMQLGGYVHSQVEPLTSKAAEKPSQVVEYIYASSFANAVMLHVLHTNPRFTRRSAPHIQILGPQIFGFGCTVLVQQSLSSSKTE